MARSNSKTGGKSKIRFIMLEAELSEGDLSEVTAAIQNALKPKQPQYVVQQIHADSALEQDPSLGELEELVDDLDDDGEAKAKTTSKRKTTYRTPQVVEITLDTTPSLKEFAADHPPGSLTDKHLVILGWADECSELDALDVDQVYTAFRHLGWPSHQKDFSQPLRDLKKRQLISGSAKDGYKINHIGRGRVEEMSKGG